MATARRDLIVIGASSGGLSALMALLRELPATLPAAVVAIIHQPDRGPNLLVEILDRVGALRAREAEDGLAIEPGGIYLPPIDHHLMVEDGRFRVSRGPKENFARPSVDALFRSAARSYGARAIGVILSGTLSDGTAGLLAIKRRRGLAIIQDPKTASFPGMPTSALEFIEPDQVGPPEKIGALLAELAGSPADAGASRPGESAEVDVQEEGDKDMDLVNSLGSPSMFSCPECKGVLWEIKDGQLTRYRCHAGHAHSLESLAHGKQEDLETALWTAIRSLKEKAEISRRISERARTRGNTDVVRSSEEKVAFMERQVAALRELIEKL